MITIGKRDWGEGGLDASQTAPTNLSATSCSSVLPPFCSLSAAPYLSARLSILLGLCVFLTLFFCAGPSISFLRSSSQFCLCHVALAPPLSPLSSCSWLHLYRLFSPMPSWIYFFLGCPHVFAHLRLRSFISTVFLMHSVLC